MRVNPASCFHYQRLALPVRNSVLGIELCLNAFRRVKDNWTQPTGGNLTNQSSLTLVVLNSSGCVLLVSASWPIPPADCSCAFHLCIEKWGLVPFSNCKCGALHKPEITLFWSATCIVHYKEHEFKSFR